MSLLRAIATAAALAAALGCSSNTPSEDPPPIEPLPWVPSGPAPTPRPEPDDTSGPTAAADATPEPADIAAAPPPEDAGAPQATTAGSSEEAALPDPVAVDAPESAAPAAAAQPTGLEVLWLGEPVDTEAGAGWGWVEALWIDRESRRLAWVSVDRSGSETPSALPFDGISRTAAGSLVARGVSADTETAMGQMHSILASEVHVPATAPESAAPAPAAPPRAFDPVAVVRAGAPEELQGVVTRVVRDDPGAGGALVCILKDSNNRLHRVHLAPADFLVDGGALPSVGDRYRVEAARTRDDRGLVYVASASGRPGRRVALRDPDGEARWDEDAARATSARESRPPSVIDPATIRAEPTSIVCVDANVVGDPRGEVLGRLEGLVLGADRVVTFVLARDTTEFATGPRRYAIPLDALLPGAHAGRPTRFTGPSSDAVPMLPDGLPAALEDPALRLELYALFRLPPPAAPPTPSVSGDR